MNSRSQRLETRSALSCVAIERAHGILHDTYLDTVTADVVKGAEELTGELIDGSPGRKRHVELNAYFRRVALLVHWQLGESDRLGANGLLRRCLRPGQASWILNQCTPVFEQV